jgi:hypothetical protein
MPNKKLYIFIPLFLLLAFAAGLATGRTASSSTAPEPGSAGDPLVTLNYLKAYVRENAGGGGAGAFKVVNVRPGQTLEGGEGTELILRAGVAVAVGNAAGNGISNISVGKDLATGERLNANQLMIVPRADGRGIRVPPAASGDAVFMVRGAYEIR